MKFLEGKSVNERNKIIAAAVLGVLAIGALFLSFGRGIFTSSATTVKVTASPTPRSAATPRTSSDGLRMPTQSEQDFEYMTVPVVYDPMQHYAPDPGRNIFAFYEPPPPCPTCPTPTPPPVKTPTPTPTPTPPYIITAVSPDSVYAGSRTFRMEVTGDKFDTDARILLSQFEVPTTYAGPNRLIGEVPAGFIANEGQRQIVVQSTDGSKYSLPVMFNVQAPPRPQFQYIGMIARKRYNNDTAYFLEQGKPTPIAARLNDIVGGRFRLVSVSADETILEDVNLGFRHPLPLFRPAPGTPAAGGAPPVGRGSGFPGQENYVPYNPVPNYNVVVPQPIPGIPENIPRYVPPNTNTNTNQQPRRQPKKTDDDDDDDNDDGNK